MKIRKPYNYGTHFVEQQNDEKRIWMWICKEGGEYKNYKEGHV